MTSPVRPFALLGAVAFLVAACGQNDEQQAPPPPEVGVIEAAPQTVSLERELVGRLAPFRSADVRARVAGVLLERAYEEGSMVKEGQVLFRIDPAPLQATLSANQASLAQAQATYANAKVAADRARQLAPQNFVSRSDLDNAEAAERSAAAAVQAARAGVASARINLDYATVRAPIPGYAGKQQVTEGALVGEGTATLLTTVDQIDPLYVNFSISVEELDQLRQAQSQGDVALAGQGKAKVQVVLPDGSVYGEAGVLDFSDVVVAPDTGAVSLRARIPNSDRTLMPGTFVTVRADLGQRRNAYLLPHAAVLRDATAAYVYVVGQDGNVARKNIMVDGARNGQWLVTGGLAGGDRVVASGVQKVQEGAPATATPWQPETAPGAAPAPTPPATPAPEPEPAPDAQPEPQQTQQ